MSEIYIKEDGGFHLDRANALLAGIGNGSAIYEAVGSALKRAAQSGRAKAGTFASQQYNISSGKFKSHINERFEMSGIGGSMQSVKISFSGSVIPLIEFATTYSKNGGVNVSVKKGGGGNISKAFIANFGKYGVFERVAKGKGGLKHLYGPSAAHMMMNEGVIQAMDEHITEVFNSRIEHEISRILNGW